jgi:adenine-specific DNA-methyltransferase
MPPAKKKPSDPTPIDAIVHGDKRANIPTADAQVFVSSEVEAPQQLLYPRDPSLDPQLVWKGKDEQDRSDLAVDAPPIYIQEKIDPRVLVENLRNTAKAGEQEPELTLFESFDGLDGLDVVDFYKHDANWSNRMILGDSLQVLASLAERESLRGKVQMIYIDPPYGIKFGSNWQLSARKRDVKDGKLEDATREAEQIKAFRDTWENGISSYLAYLRDRLVVARDLLTESGSVFVQIGDENVHLVRSLMDEVFGSDNFVSQITYKSTAGLGSRYLAGASNFLLWYSRDYSLVKYRELYASKNVGDAGAALYTRVRLEDGSYRTMSPAERADSSLLPPSVRLFRPDNLVSQRPPQEGDLREFHLDGIRYTPGNGVFKTDRNGLERLALAGRLWPTTGGTLQYVRYLDDFTAMSFSNVWTDTGTGSFTDPKIYVVQTNTKIVERCMLMCTDPGDLVVDPTCGSGTTAYVAEQWGRRWITTDTSRVALALARQRIMGAKFPYYVLADTPEGRAKEGQLAGEPLPASTTTNNIRKGFVYERVQHITLKSIANNPDIVDGTSRDEIDAAIKRHADFELLYDRPIEDKKRVRVSGPFTVESLSPHRSLSFAGNAPATEQAAAEDAGADSFEQTILDNLAKAGIQNGARAERLTFGSIETYAGTHIQAVADNESIDDGAPRRIALSIGPQYGTVGPSFIKNAAREALAASDVDMLCVLAFAFDPTAVGSTDDYVSETQGFANVAATRQLGRMPVQLVRMNADLLMGEDLKKTGAGNLFTVFGEPEIVISETSGELTVEILGVDVYDPTTGQVRSNDTSKIALWMIDTNYNEESFFVRHCYFTGGNDPYKRLKTALKADIDEDAWESLYSTTSRPFPRPETGKIAVKVINDYGDEVMKVFTV